MKKLIPLFCLGMIFGLTPTAHAEGESADAEAQNAVAYDQLGDANPGVAGQDDEEKPFKLTEKQREWMKDAEFNERLDKKINGEYLMMYPPTKAQMSLEDQQKFFKQIRSRENEKFLKVPAKAKDTEEDDDND